MIKIKALNESVDSSDEDLSQTYLVTREAEEDGLKSVYEEAIRNLSAGEEELAKQLLLKLNESLSDKTVKQKCSSEAFYQKLQYSTLKNLGIITNDINYYLDALELDATDVSLWLKTGRRAALLLNYQLARECYESAYRLSPENWIVIDRLIETTFVLHDLYHCFKHCCYAIERDPSYTKAIILFNECLSLHPILHKNMDVKYKQYMGQYDPEEYETVVAKLRQLKAKRRQHFEEDRIRQESKRPRLTLFLDINSTTLTLSSIGLKLKTLYDKIKKNNWFLSTPIDISYDSGHNSQTDNESGSANTSADESQSTATEPKEKDVPSAEKESVQTVESESESFSKPKLKRTNSMRNSNSSFPSEFVDKRRSSRVKNILNKSKDIDERNVSESILDLLPESLKTAVVEQRPITPEANEEQQNIFHCINICEKAESDYIKGFFDRVKVKKARRKFLMIDDLIEVYLREVGLAMNLIIPSVFTELYTIYRQCHELPCGPLTVIGRDIDVEQIWMCLTANELKFNRNEAMFLTQILFPLELTLSADHYKEFVVRLSMLRGTKENDNDFLVEAMDILVKNEIEVMASNKVVIKYDAIKSILDSQSRENMSQMMAEHHFEELIKILRDKPESELKDEEINLLNDAIVSSELWEKGIDILCTRAELNNECLSTIRQCLETGKRARLKHPLAMKLVKLAAEGYSVLPWICLYWGLIAEAVDANGPKSTIIKFLKLGHQYLGKRGTCTSHGGEFLLLALNHFLENDCEEEICRCFTCLFNFPLRKIQANPSVSSPNIHKSPHITLKWEHCEQLYHYFVPEELPEYDSVLRQTGITQDIEGLLMRIVELIPSHLKPDGKTEPITKYIEDGEPIPDNLTAEKSHITETIYYLLADYYFKNTEFKKARLFYLYDLSLNPNRFDSWAASALARTWEVDQQLLSGEVNESFYGLTIASQRCFQKALSLERGNTKLWLEFGHFVYNISSSASRFRKTSLFKPQAEFKITSEEMIKIAKNCFESALKTDEGEELWLPYYMLGKVMEKCSLSAGPSSLLTAIKYYEWAELCLYADGTSYPKKIQYYNPPALAVEALEIHYRIHASILKYLTYNQKFSSRVLKRLKLHLVRALRSPFTKQSTPSSTNAIIPLDHDYTSPTAGSSNIACDSVTELVSDMVDSVVLRDQKMDITALRTELIVMCLNAMRRCVDRYPAHYKSIYRLASYYHMVNNNSTAKQILIGMGNQKSVNICLPTSSDKIGTDPSDNAKLIPGLFAERKGNNLFNGIWRIPIDDIDRPGSFSAHMFRSTFLLIRVCTFTNDYHQLCTIAIQLSRAPEAGKKFLRDSDRQILAKLAFDSCTLLLKSRLGQMTVGTRDWTVVDVQKIFDRFTKASVFVKESNEVIRELFAMTRR